MSEARHPQHDETTKLSAREDGPYLFSLVAVAATLGILDSYSLIVEMPWWVVVGLTLAVVLPPLLRRSNVLRAIAFLLVLGWVLALPAIRWNVVKSFYIDCKAIQGEMPIGTVKDKMAAYHLAFEWEGRTPVRTDLDRPHLTFHPSLSHSADWCLVFNDGDRVSEVAVSGD